MQQQVGPQLGALGLGLGLVFGGAFLVGLRGESLSFVGLPQAVGFAIGRGQLRFVHLSQTICFGLRGESPGFVFAPQAICFSPRSGGFRLGFALHSRGALGGPQPCLFSFPGDAIGFRQCGRFPVGARPALGRQLLFFDLLHRDDPGILRHLNGFPRHGPDRFLAGLPDQIAFGILETDHGLLECVACIVFGTRPARDLHRVTRLVEFQRHFRVELQGANVAGLHIQDILPSLQQLIFRVHFFDGSDGVFADEILHHHHVARLCDREVWLGGDDQSEGLQLGGGIQLGFAAVIEQHFADVGRAAFRSDGPHYIGQVLMAELRGRPQLLHLRVDFDDALLALHLGLATCFGHQRRSAKTDPGGSATVIVVDGFRRPRHHRNAIDGRSAVFYGLLSWIGSLWSLCPGKLCQRESAHRQE